MTESRRATQVGDVMELLALVVLCVAGFAAPTDWNITIGLVLAALSMVAVSYFALSPEQEDHDVTAA